MKLINSLFVLFSFLILKSCAQEDLAETAKTTDAPTQAPTPMPSKVEGKFDHTIEKMAGMSPSHSQFSAFTADLSFFGGTIGESCVDFDAWQDDFGDGCGWYFGEDGCAGADIWAVDVEFTANQACCYCGGGHRGGDAVQTLVVGGGDCRNVPGFFDVDFDGCELYDEAPDFYCSEYGHGLDYIPGLTANVACCVCGGGIRGA